MMHAYQVMVTERTSLPGVEIEYLLMTMYARVLQAIESSEIGSPVSLGQDRRRFDGA